jgi:hypothetical protein
MMPRKKHTLAWEDQKCTVQYMSAYLLRTSIYMHNIMHDAKEKTYLGMGTKRCLDFPGKQLVEIEALEEGVLLHFNGAAIVA